MKYPREEQGTIIRKGALDDHWSIYTSDTVMMTKLDKLVATSDEWKETGYTGCQGDICAKEYACPKNLISIRSKTKTLTEAQKKALTENGFKSQK